MNEFDEKAATWDDDPSRVQRAAEFAKHIKSKVDLSRVNSALEYGGGTGLLSFHLLGEIDQITLMDESSEMIKVVKDKCELGEVQNLKPIQMNLLQDPLPNKRYDLIYVMLTLHHVEEVEELIGIFRLLLNPSGVLAIIDLEKEDGSFHYGQPFHGHEGFERNALEKMLTETGLNPVHYDICYTIQKETETGMKNFPVFLLTADLDTI